MLRRRKNTGPSLKATEIELYHFFSSDGVCDTTIKDAAKELSIRMAYNAEMQADPGHDDMYYQNKAENNYENYIGEAMEKAWESAQELIHKKEKELAWKSRALAEEVGCDEETAEYFLKEATGKGAKHYNYPLAKRNYLTQ